MYKIATPQKKFLEICDKNKGHLYSVDIVDCSKVSDNKNWTFIQSRDDNFNLIKSKYQIKLIFFL